MLITVIVGGGKRGQSRRTEAALKRHRRLPTLAENYSKQRTTLTNHHTSHHIQAPPQWRTTIFWNQRGGDEQQDGGDEAGKDGEISGQAATGVQLMPPAGFEALVDFAPDTCEVDVERDNGQEVFILGKDFWAMYKKEVAAASKSGKGRGGGAGADAGAEGGGKREKVVVWSFEACPSKPPIASSR